jgi:predicted house-cleaning NTP pyrophosphatase (Maf/HAM1 superfamily)
MRQSTVAWLATSEEALHRLLHRRRRRKNDYLNEECVQICADDLLQSDGTLYLKPRKTATFRTRISDSGDAGQAET